MQGCAFARNIPSRGKRSIESGLTRKPLHPTTGQMTDALPSQQSRARRCSCNLQDNRRFPRPCLVAHVQPYLHQWIRHGVPNHQSTSMPVPKVAMRYSTSIMDCSQPGLRVLRTCRQVERYDSILVLLQLDQVMKHLFLRLIAQLGLRCCAKFGESSQRNPGIAQVRVTRITAAVSV